MRTPTEQALLQRLGHAIRHARDRAGISQEELAERCGLHRTYVGSVERGERNIGMLNLAAIAKALDVPASELCRSIDHR